MKKFNDMDYVRILVVIANISLTFSGMVLIWINSLFYGKIRDGAAGIPENYYSIKIFPSLSIGVGCILCVLSVVISYSSILVKHNILFMQSFCYLIISLIHLLVGMFSTLMMNKGEIRTEVNMTIKNLFSGKNQTYEADCFGIKGLPLTIEGTPTCNGVDNEQNCIEVIYKLIFFYTDFIKLYTLSCVIQIIISMCIMWILHFDNECKKHEPSPSSQEQVPHYE